MKDPEILKLIEKFNTKVRVTGWYRVIHKTFQNYTTSGDYICCRYKGHDFSGTNTEYYCIIPLSGEVGSSWTDASPTTWKLKYSPATKDPYVTPETANARLYMLFAEYPRNALARKLDRL